MDFLKKEMFQKAITKVGMIAGVFLIMKYLLPIIFPFVIAFLIVLIFYPCIQRIWKRTHINKGILMGSILVILLIGIMGIGILLCSQLVNGASTAITQSGSLKEDICGAIRTCCGAMEGHFGINANKMERYVLEQVTIMSDSLQVEVMPKVMGKSMTYLSRVASLFAKIVITFIASILLAKDYEKIMTYLQNCKSYKKIAETIKRIGKLFIVFTRAQLIIMLVIATVSGIGFWILKMPNAIIMGIVTSILDVFPFIGTGIVIVPIALFQLLTGNFIKAAGYIILYAVCALAREFLEPKLIGDKIGIYPIVILLAVYVGIKLYGMSGILLGPLSMLLIFELWKVENIDK